MQAHQQKLGALAGWESQQEGAKTRRTVGVQGIVLAKVPWAYSASGGHGVVAVNVQGVCHCVDHFRSHSASGLHGQEQF